MLGVGFDGSSVRGFAEINESDLLIIPDKYTFMASIPFVSTNFIASLIFSLLYDRQTLAILG